MITVRIKTETNDIDVTNIPSEITNNQYGAYFFFHETSDSQLGTTGENEHVWHTTGNITGTSSIQANTNIHTSNTAEQWINDDGITTLGSSIENEFTVLTFTYEPTFVTNGFQTKFASFGFYVKNVNENVYIDYVIVTGKLIFYRAS